MATHEERKKLTRQKLIDSAKKLFDKEGYENTSLEQIITLANVAKGTFYQHFKTKLDILITLSREENSHQAKEVLALVSQGANAIDVLDNYLDSMGKWFEAHEKIAESLVIANLTQKEEETITHPEYSSRGFIHSVLNSAQEQGHIKRDADTLELTAMIGGFTVVSILHWSRYPIKGELSKSLRSKFKLFLDGVRS